jgi:apolipoprotein N-acyltransferase
VLAVDRKPRPVGLRPLSVPLLLVVWDWGSDEDKGKGKQAVPHICALESSLLLWLLLPLRLQLLMSALILPLLFLLLSLMPSSLPIPEL